MYPVTLAHHALITWKWLNWQCSSEPRILAERQSLFLKYDLMVNVFASFSFHPTWRDRKEKFWGRMESSLNRRGQLSRKYVSSIFVGPCYRGECIPHTLKQQQQNVSARFTCRRGSGFQGPTLLECLSWCPKVLLYGRVREHLNLQPRHPSDAAGFACANACLQRVVFFRISRNPEIPGFPGSRLLLLLMGHRPRIINACELCIVEEPWAGNLYYFVSWEFSFKSFNGM